MHQSQTATYTKLRSPLNLLESTPPNVSSPFVIESVVVGSKDMPISFVVTRPWEKALSSTVGTSPPSDVVPAMIEPFVLKT